MSKKNFYKSQEQTPVTTEETEVTENKPVESTVEEPTETKPEEVTEVVESPAEETPVIEQVTVVEPESITEEKSQPVDERQSLIAELDVKPAGVDTMTGQPILPNTPMLRRMKELQESKENSVTKLNKTLTEVVKEKYSEQTAKHPTVVYLVSVLSEYVERMSPTNVVEETAGANYQLKLARAYDAALSAEPELAMVCLEIIVATVTEHLNGAFSERYALRFINVAKLNSEQAYRFHMLTTLFIELGRRAHQKSPAPIGESVNIQKLMDFIPDRNAKANLAEFLS